MCCQFSLKGKKTDDPKYTNGIIKNDAITIANLSKFKIEYPLVYCQPTLSINFTAFGLRSPNLFSAASFNFILPQLLNI